MTTQSAVDIALRWQDAANRQDTDALLALSAVEIEIVGPRGTVFGHDILRDWLARAGLTLHTQRLFAKDADVVIVQHGVWASGDEEDIASHFRVAAEQVIYLLATTALQTPSPPLG